MLEHLDDAALERLEQITPIRVPAGGLLFRAGESAEVYPIVLSGTVDVFLTSASGREIMLYAVSSGQACIQSTLGLLGETAYSAEGRAVSDCLLVLVPKPMFVLLLSQSEAFRKMVFSAFGDRMKDITYLLEKVAFERVELRIADALIALHHRQGSAVLSVTQSELASRVGTAREVVSRKLEQWAAQGLLKTTRGAIELLDLDAIFAISDGSALSQG